MFKKSEKVAQYVLPIKLKKQKAGGFLAECTVWPDCYAQGDSIDEAVLEITSVAQTLIDLYKEEGLKVPLKKGIKVRLDNPFSVPVISTS